MTSNPTPATGGEPLSVDQAADLLSGGAPAPGLSTSAEPGSDEDDFDLEPGEEETEEEEATSIRPPESWDEAAQARFRDLPADIQALIAEREGERERATGQAMQEAAEAMQMAEALDHLLPQAAQTFAGKWDQVDWAAWAQADPQAAFHGRMQFEAEQAELHQLVAAQAQAQAVSHRHFVAGEAARLKAIAPELADPKAGPQRRQAVASFLVDLGATDDQLANLTAEEASLAYDALQWRQARRGLAPDRGGEAGALRTLRPSAAQAPRSSQERRSADALARLTKSGSIDDAVAFLRSRG